MTLKIHSISAKSAKVPLKREIGSAGGNKSSLDYLIVELKTEEGISGFGYTMGLGGNGSKAMAPYIQNELAPLVIGEDVSSPERIWNTLWSPNKARMRGGLGVMSISALDTACWDAFSKSVSMPLHTILGGFRKKVPVYGSGGWFTFSDNDLVEECQNFMKKGITAYKIKIGTPRDEERIALLRKEIGNEITLLVDSNQKYNIKDAIEVSSMLANYDVKWFEEPVLADSIDDLAEFSKKSAVPVAAGENSYMRWGFREICERKAAAYLQPDVGRCGGVTEFRKIAHLAEAFNLDLCSHLLEEVSVCLIGATPAGCMVEYADLLPADSLTHDFVVHDGHIEVPENLGHGVTFTKDALKSFCKDTN